MNGGGDYRTKIPASASRNTRNCGAPRSRQSEVEHGIAVGAVYRGETLFGGLAGKVNANRFDPDAGFDVLN